MSAAQGAGPAPSNGYNAEKVKNYVERIEALHADIASIMGAALNECKQVHGDIKIVLDEAKDSDGIPKKALRKVIKARSLERKAAEVRDDLDGDDQDSFDLIRHALGDLGDTPLGAAALERAGLKTGAETTRTKRPRKRKSGGEDVAVAESHTDTSDAPFAAPADPDMPKAPAEPVN